MYIVFYTDRLIPQQFAGCARGPVIFIRPKYKNDKGLLEHEKVHVRQFWRTLGFHGLIYKFSKSYRLKCELEAYSVQLRYSPHSADAFAKFIAEKYDLDIAQAEAKEALLIS